MTTKTINSLKWNKADSDGEYRSSCGRFEVRVTRAVETHWSRDVWNLFEVVADGIEWIESYDRLKDAKQDAQRFAN